VHEDEKQDFKKPNARGSQVKILVTGAGGYVGYFLCQRLVAAGHNVIGLCLAEQTEMLGNTGCTLHVHDLGSREEIEAEPVDAVVYLAQSVFYRQMPEKAYDLFEVNVSGLVKAADFARKTGARKFLYASTGSVYRPSLEALKEDSPVRDDDFYVLSKITGERILDLYRRHFTVTTVRFFTIYGPNQKGMLVPAIIEKVKTGTPVFLEPAAGEEGENEGLRLTPCYIDDAVDAIETLLGTDVGSPINIASPEIVSIRQIAEEAGRLMNKKPIFAQANTSRNWNLIADTTLLKTYKQKFTPFARGMNCMLSTGGQHP
jgi:nucleoside-diphosphate-sugar epimerase